MTKPSHLFIMPADDIISASRANLQKWQDQLLDFTIKNLGDEGEEENVRLTANQLKLIAEQLKKIDPPAKTVTTTATPSHLVEIRHAFELEKETDLSDADQVELWIRKIRQAKTDFVDHLSDSCKAEAEALLARTARKYFSNEVRQSFDRQNLPVNTVETLIEAMETMYSSKLSVFQYLKRVHEVKYVKSKGLLAFVNELSEAQRRAFRHVERLQRHAAKAIEVIDEDGKPVHIKQEDKSSSSTPAQRKQACSCLVKAHDFSHLTAACLAYLKVSELYPHVAMKLCDSIDDCKTAQDVYNKAKVLIDRFPAAMTSEDSNVFGAKSSSWTKKSNGQNDKKPTLESTLQSIVDRLKNLEEKKDEAKNDDQSKKQNKGKKKRDKRQTDAHVAETSEASSTLDSNAAHFRPSV